MRVKVNVTPKVLERAKMCGFDDREIISNCMLVVAFRDLFPDCTVSVITANLLGGFLHYRKDQVYLPEIAIENRERFDSLGPSQRVLMSPFSFEIEVPEYVIEKIGLNQIYKVLSESKSLEMVMPKEEHV